LSRQSLDLWESEESPKPRLLGGHGRSSEAKNKGSALIYCGGIESRMNFFKAHTAEWFT
jgi:hypothetical protein